MATFFKKDIASVYNNVLYGYLKDGYKILPKEHSCFCETEDYEILVKDNYPRLQISFHYEFILGYGLHPKEHVMTLNIEVDSYDNKVDPLLKFTYYCVSIANDIYVDDIDELKQVMRKRKARVDRKIADVKCSGMSRRKADISKLSNKFISDIMKKINSKYGFKHANSSCIDSVTIISSNNKHNKHSLSAEIDFSYNNRNNTIIIKPKV